MAAFSIRLMIVFIYFFIFIYLFIYLFICWFRTISRAPLFAAARGGTRTRFLALKYSFLPRETYKTDALSPRRLRTALVAPRPPATPPPSSSRSSPNPNDPKRPHRDSRPPQRSCRFVCSARDARRFSRLRASRTLINIIIIAPQSVIDPKLKPNNPRFRVWPVVGCVLSRYAATPTPHSVHRGAMCTRNTQHAIPFAALARCPGKSMAWCRRTPKTRRHTAHTRIYLFPFAVTVTIIYLFYYHFIIIIVITFIIIIIIIFIFIIIIIIIIYCSNFYFYRDYYRNYYYYQKKSKSLWPIPHVRVCYFFCFIIYISVYICSKARPDQYATWRYEVLESKKRNTEQHTFFFFFFSFHSWIYRATLLGLLGLLGSFY